MEWLIGIWTFSFGWFFNTWLMGAQSFWKYSILLTCQELISNKTTCIRLEEAQMLKKRFSWLLASWKNRKLEIRVYDFFPPVERGMFFFRFFFHYLSFLVSSCCVCPLIQKILCFLLSCGPFLFSSLSFVSFSQWKSINYLMQVSF